MQVVEYIPHESLSDVTLDILSLAAIEWTFPNEFSNFLARPCTNLIILILHCFSIISLCAVLHVLHHTPFALIGLGVLSVLWHVLAATTVNYRASKKLRHMLEPQMQTRQFRWNAGRRPTSPSAQQHHDFLSPLPSPSQRSVSSSTPAIPTSTQSQIHRVATNRATSPTSKKPARPSSHPSSILFRQRWNELKRPKPTYTLSHIPRLAATNVASPPRKVPKRTNDTVSQLSSNHHPATHSSRYTRPPGLLTRDSDTLQGYFLKGTYMSPWHTPSSYTPSTGRTPSIYYAHTRGLDTSHTNVLPTPPTKSRMPRVPPTKATSPTKVLPTPPTKSGMPRVPRTKATSPTNKEPTWSSRHTSPIRQRVRIEEPKTQASRRDRQSISGYLVRPNTSVEINRPHGIENYGNTCFINAGIQCLNWSGGFLELIERAPLDDKGLIDALVTTMRQCRDRNVNFVDPWPLFRALALWAPALVTIVKGPQHQEDSAILVGAILAAVSQQYKTSQKKSEEYQRNKLARLRELWNEKRNTLISRMTGATTNIFSACKNEIIRLLQIDRECASLDHSPVNNFCQASFVSIAVCQGCFTAHFNSDKYYLFLLLYLLDISQVDDVTIPLTDLFLTLTQGKVQEERMCGQCKKSGSVKEYSLMSKPLPQTLIIQLPFAVTDKASGEKRKRRTRIAFPVTGLDLNPFLVETQIYEPGTIQPTQLYDLSAICLHTGGASLQSGHYIAYCKLSPSEQWYCFNDNLVRPVDIREIASKYVRQNAFLLYYSKRV